MIRTIRKIVLLLSIMFIPAIMVKAQSLHYNNPILAGFYPDPSICRAGNDYYLVNSSFAYFPGLPIFHSNDLVNWTQIGHAMDRLEQLDHSGARVSRGLFAPAISYHDGLFYIVCTHIDKGGNFVITASDPAGPWSNPVYLPQVNGIDPALFFDDNGKAYLLYNSIPPGNQSLYDGHRTIRMYAFDSKTLAVTGEEEILVNGGTDLSKKPVWIEGPHIIKKDGWYYLICAEGGTGYNHSEVVFRGRSVHGPFIPFEKNPILTQRHLDPARPDPVTTTGHADFVETPEGKWYAVFLGCRPYEGHHYNTGRETFMAPVTWKDGWPSILEGDATVGFSYPVPMPARTARVTNAYNGNFRYRDEFSHASFDHRWIFLRTPFHKWYSLEAKKGWLEMDTRPETCGGKGNPSFIAHRQQHIRCEAATQLRFTPVSPSEKAGLIIFQNEKHYYYLCKSTGNTGPVIELFKGKGNASADTSMELITRHALPKGYNGDVNLKIESTGLTYTFAYALPGRAWVTVAPAQDARFLSTATAGGFVGSVFALYTTSQGQPSSAKARYNWFDYKGKDTWGSGRRDESRQ